VPHWRPTTLRRRPRITPVEHTVARKRRRRPSSERRISCAWAT